MRSRNARLAALRSFLKFAAHRDVSSLHVIERALGVPVKRFERPMFGYLAREEMLAVIGEQNDSWLRQRDHALFLLMCNTGARVSEITGIKVSDVVLDASAACVHLHGKGRKQRSVPLWLGHESPVTTHQYVEADLAMKERALARLREPGGKSQRYRAPDSLLTFLRAL